MPRSSDRGRTASELKPKKLLFPLRAGPRAVGNLFDTHVGELPLFWGLSKWPSMTFGELGAQAVHVSHFGNARCRKAGETNRRCRRAARCFDAHDVAQGVSSNETSRTSAAAEGRLCRKKAPWEQFETTQASACSSTVENSKSPQHHDSGRYQRGHRQHTLQGSDSHPYSPLPSPSKRSRRFVNSPAICRSQSDQSCGKVVVCRAHVGTRCSSKGKRSPSGPSCFGLLD